MMRQTFFESFQFHVVQVWMTHIVHVEYMDYVYGASRVLTVFIM